MSPLGFSVQMINQKSLLARLLQALLLLNLFDMLFTLWGVEMGIFVEANPLLRWCINQGHIVFVLMKTGLCIQFVLGSMLIADKIKYYSLLTSGIVIIYSTVVIRSFSLLIRL